MVQGGRKAKEYCTVMKGSGMKAKQKLSDKARVGATLGLWYANG
jgi:hypothetical protein